MTEPEFVLMLCAIAASRIFGEIAARGFVAWTDDGPATTSPPPA